MTQTTMQPAGGSAAGDRPPWRVVTERNQPPAPGLDWLAGRQAEALLRLHDAGLPNSDEEDWRYTSLAGFNKRWSEYLSAPDQARAPAPASQDAARLPVTGAGFDVSIIDGVLHSPPDCTAHGLTIRSLRDLKPEQRLLAERLLQEANETSPNKLIDLNTALLGDAILIAADAGSCPPGPIHVGLLAATGRALGQPRLLVDIGADSRLTLVLEHTGTGGSLVNAVHQIRVGRGSQLNLVRIQSLPDDGMLLETVELELQESASVTVTSVDLGGKLSRQSINVRLTGPGADATVNGVFIADGQRHIDNHTRLLHQAPATTSREYFRGIADGHGRGVFNGKIVVLSGAEGSSATLTNRNLLLASTAEIDTKPELEIYVDDVRCSHGATTGQLDANALFYLRSRGLDPAVARQVLTSAFLHEGLAAIAVPELRVRLEAQVQSRLGGLPAATGGSTA